MTPQLSEIQLWDTEEVAQYLETVGLGECSHVFKKRNVNGSALLNLTEDKLLLWSQNLKVIHIRKLSRLISDLKQQQENIKNKKQETKLKPGEQKNKPAVNPEEVKERRISLESTRIHRPPKNDPGVTNQRRSFPLVDEADISKTLVKTLILAEERGWSELMKFDVEIPHVKKTEILPPPLVKPSEPSFMVCHRPSNVSTKKQEVIDGDYEIPEPVPSVQTQNLVNSTSIQSQITSSVSGTLYMPVIVNTESGPSLVQPSLKDVTSHQEPEHDESVYVTLSEEDEEDRLQRELSLVDSPRDDGYEIPDVRPTEDGYFSPLPEDLRIDPPAGFAITDGLPTLPPRSDHIPPPRPLPMSPKQPDDLKSDDGIKGKSGILETFKKISGARFFPTSNAQMPNVPVAQKHGATVTERDRPAITKSQISSPKPVATSPTQVSLPKPVTTPPTLPERPPLLAARVSPSSTPPSTPKRSTNVPGSPVLCQQKSASGLRPLPPLPQPSSPQGEENTPPSVANPLLGRPWYQPIGRKEAEVLLKQGTNGTFLIRDSKHGGPSNPFTLSLLYESRVFHIFVRRRLDLSYALGSEKEHEMKFTTIDALVLFYQKEPLQLYCEGKPAGSTPLITWPSGA